MLNFMVSYEKTYIYKHQGIPRKCLPTWQVKKMFLNFPRVFWILNVFQVHLCFTHFPRITLFTSFVVFNFWVYWFWRVLGVYHYFLWCTCAVGRISNDSITFDSGTVFCDLVMLKGKRNVAAITKVPSPMLRQGNYLGSLILSHEYFTVILADGDLYIRSREVCMQ